MLMNCNLPQIRQTKVNGTIVSQIGQESTEPRQFKNSKRFDKRTTSLKKKQIASILRGLDSLAGNSSGSDDDLDGWQATDF